MFSSMYKTHSLCCCCCAFYWSSLHTRCQPYFMRCTRTQSRSEWLLIDIYITKYSIQPIVKWFKKQKKTCISIQSILRAVFVRKKFCGQEFLFIKLYGRVTATRTTLVSFRTPFTLSSRYIVRLCAMRRDIVHCFFLLYYVTVEWLYGLPCKTLILCCCTLLLYEMPIDWKTKVRCTAAANKREKRIVNPKQSISKNSRQLKPNNILLSARKKNVILFYYSWRQSQSIVPNIYCYKRWLACYGSRVLFYTLCYRYFIYYTTDTAVFPQKFYSRTCMMIDLHTFVICWSSLDYVDRISMWCLRHIRLRCLI